MIYMTMNMTVQAILQKRLELEAMAHLVLYGLMKTEKKSAVHIIKQMARQ